MIPPISTSTASIPLDQPSSAAQRTKFDKVTRQFEGILINSLWSEFQNDPMAETDDSDAGGDTMRSMGVQAMSTALAAHGGLGLAGMIEKQLGGQVPGTPSATPSTPSSGGGQTAWNPLKFGLGPADKAHETEKQTVPNPSTGGRK